jgi:hypothetical protein
LRGRRARSVQDRRRAFRRPSPRRVVSPTRKGGHGHSRDRSAIRDELSSALDETAPAGVVSAGRRLASSARSASRSRRGRGVRFGGRTSARGLGRRTRIRRAGRSRVRTTRRRRFRRGNRDRSYEDDGGDGGRHLSPPASGVVVGASGGVWARRRRSPSSSTVCVRLPVDNIGGWNRSPISRSARRSRSSAPW